MADLVAPTSVPRKLSSAATYRRHQRKIAKDIEHQQKSADPIIPYTSFSRIVHEIVADCGQYCVRSEAIRALQEAAESRMTDMFVDANKLAGYNGRETVSRADLEYVTPAAEWSAVDDVAMAAESEHQLPLPDLSST